MVLEALAVLFTLLCVGPLVGGAQVVLQSDYAGVVFMLLKEHSRDPRLCALLQAIVGVQERYGFRVLLGHTSTHCHSGGGGGSVSLPPHILGAGRLWPEVDSCWLAPDTYEAP